uniref:Uncharacterized protein n=1 Tax=viral metagenome TaxID=1070528 RepID=A0A6M3KPR0_9ZZZZ
MGFMLLPNTRSLSVVNTERVCNVVLDNNWELIKDFIDEIHDLGINRVVFCDWATKEQIAHGKWCPAGIIGNYIKTRTEEFGYTVTITMLDGRDVL